MIFNRFFINISTRIALILLTGFLCAYLLNVPERVQTIVVLAVLTVLQIVLLTYFVNKTNRELAAFIISLKEGDYTKAFSTKRLEQTFKGLHFSFNEISRLMSAIQKESQAKSAYIAAITENLPLSIIAVRANSKIDFCNKAFLSLTGEKESPYHLASIANPEIAKIITFLKVGTKTSQQININNESKILAFQAVNFKHENQETKIISIQDIQKELTQNEMEAQKKLIRILNHEVMNSLAPISTLTSTIQRILEKNEQLNKQHKNNIAESASLIEKRSDGLASFIQSYKELTNLPEPQKKPIQLNEFLQAMQKLFESELKKKGVKLSIGLEDTETMIFADQNMMEQIFLNVIKNAVESINHKNGEIKIAVKVLANSKTSIQISNNGTPIPNADRKNIFLPFFSTKQNGSGIGLSLSKQIVHLHGGELTLQNGQEPTVFEIRF